jgi:hypothetical protein
MNPHIQSHIGLVQLDSEPDWSRTCEVCCASPVVPETRMCGPCTFGEADTAGGNWVTPAASLATAADRLPRRTLGIARSRSLSLAFGRHCSR